MTSTHLSLTDARRLAVKGAMLSAPRPRSILEVAEWLGSLQIDPTTAVARAELLVLWSRLGPYDVGEVAKLLVDEHRLFEYWAHLVPMSDFAIHRETMRRYPRGDHARARYIREWLAANAAFRRYVLRELRKRGPLPSRELEDRAVVPWKTGGWNDGKSLGRMLDILWFGGAISIVGRDGNERLWDLAERWLPVDEARLKQGDVARRLVERQLRWCGLARLHAFGFAFDGAPPGRERALRELIREGRAVPITVEGLSGEWLVHADVLAQPFRGRTTLLAPFDKLIQHRDFTEEVFGFRYRLEMYFPKARREYGFYVPPILHGDRLVDRIDPSFDRKEGVLRINGVWWEPDAPKNVPLEKTVAELARWVGAKEVTWP